jgi:hypothetical protein
MVAQVCNHSTPEASVGGSQVTGQSGLPSKTLSQKQMKKNRKHER